MHANTMGGGLVGQSLFCNTPPMPQDKMGARTITGHIYPIT
jgi:hypothetical protein